MFVGLVRLYGIQSGRAVNLSRLLLGPLANVRFVFFLWPHAGLSIHHYGKRCKYEHEDGSHKGKSGSHRRHDKLSPSNVICLFSATRNRYKITGKISPYLSVRLLSGISVQLHKVGIKHVWIYPFYDVHICHCRSGKHRPNQESERCEGGEDKEDDPSEADPLNSRSSEGGSNCEWRREGDELPLFARLSLKTLGYLHLLIDEMDRRFDDLRTLFPKLRVLMLMGRHRSHSRPSLARHGGPMPVIWEAF